MADYQVDAGLNFGTWGDRTSRYMYETSLVDILPLVGLRGRVGDFGGANGLLRGAVARAGLPVEVVTIDHDASKKPDVVDDLLGHREPYDVAWLRYVLHYLTDQEVLDAFRTIVAQRFVVVQFVNDDLRTKYRNSHGETKFFRTEQQTRALLPNCAKCVYSEVYRVGADFYKNRLGLEGAQPHNEKLMVFVWERNDV